MTVFNANDNDKMVGCLLVKEVKSHPHFRVGVDCPGCEEVQTMSCMIDIGEGVYKCPNCGYLALMDK